MAWSGLGISLRWTFLLITLVVVVLSNEPPEEKSYCTGHTCDEDGITRISEITNEEGDVGVHLAYQCSSPNFVPEEDSPVIFLHGMTDTRHTWDGIYQKIPILAHRKACVYDARNHGDSDWNNTFGTDVLAKDLEHFMDKMQIEKAVLVGHSMGGFTVMKFAVDNPSRVDGLFIEDISPIGLPEESIVFVRDWLNMLKNIISSIPEGTDETAAKKAVAENLSKLGLHELPEYFFKDPPIRQRDGVWQWKVNFDIAMKCLVDPDLFFTKYDGQYDGKTVFIYGKSSQFGVADHEEQIRKIFPTAEFFGVEGAGHMIHHLHSEFLIKLMEFLQ